MNSQVIDVLNGLNQPVDIGLYNDELFIIEQQVGKISKINLSGTNPIPTDVVSGLNNPVEILIDGTNLYIVEEGVLPLNPNTGLYIFDGKISKIDISSNNPQLVDVITELALPSGIALKNNNLYISHGFGVSISKVDISSNNPTVNSIEIGLQPTKIIDFYGNDLYLFDLSCLYKIDILNTLPTPESLMCSSGMRYASFDQDDLYISYPSTNQISKINITDSNPVPQQVLSGLNGPSGSFVHNGILYFTQRDSGKVSKIDLSSLSVHEHDFKDVVTLSPNPSSDYISIQGITGEDKASIYNNYGVKILELTFYNAKKINIQDLSTGIYYLKLENNRTTIKFIKN